MNVESLDENYQNQFNKIVHQKLRNMWWADINLWEVSFDGKKNTIDGSDHEKLSK